MSSRDPLWVNCAAKDFCLAYQAPLWSRFESCRSLVLVLEVAVILACGNLGNTLGGAWVKRVKVGAPGIPVGMSGYQRGLCALVCLSYL